jgi:hypothetical protein
MQPFRPMPKLISFFLIDGIPDGRVACELSNWTGKAYKIPRTLFKDAAASSLLGAAPRPIVCVHGMERCKKNPCQSITSRLFKEGSEVQYISPKAKPQCNGAKRNVQRPRHIAMLSLNSSRRP